MVINKKICLYASDKFSDKFRLASPFPVLIIDDFLDEEFLNSLIVEISEFHELQKSSDYIFAKNKFESPVISSIGPQSSKLKEFLLSKSFEDFLSGLIGKKVFLDSDFTGGGLHRGGKDAFLDMHCDFRIHPLHSDWIRELNILLYLNKDWIENFGGHLNLEHAVTKEKLSIAPLLNRIVIMITNDISLHGYEKINFPLGMYRTSIAAYAYSIGSKKNLDGLSTTTIWQPQNASLLKRIAAQVTPTFVLIKRKILGSRTVKRTK
jgi:Rps23 Pro-64 3,4-dihydroxylase Tpa1-like proline 4-hydroxylase